MFWKRFKNKWIGIGLSQHCDWLLFMIYQDPIKNTLGIIKEGIRSICTLSYWKKPKFCRSQTWVFIWTQADFPADVAADGSAIVGTGILTYSNEKLGSELMTQELPEILSFLTFYCLGCHKIFSSSLIANRNLNRSHLPDDSQRREL